MNLLKNIGLEKLFLLFKKINQRTKTEIISDEAVVVIKNREKVQQLREEIQNYHAHGNWNMEKINSIFRFET